MKIKKPSSMLKQEAGLYENPSPSEMFLSGENFKSLEEPKIKINWVGKS